jgi:O-antigen ligase
MNAHPQRTPPANLRIRVTGVGLLALLSGILQPVIVNLVGDIYAAELLLPAAGLAALFAGGQAAFRERLFWSLILALGVTLAGYVLSDVIRDTRPDQYLRGWGRILLLAVDSIALVLITMQDRRNLWWFAFGMGVGGILHLRLLLHMPIAVWKFGYAEPMLLVAATLGCFLPMRIAAAWLATLALASMWFDFRSFAAICFLLAGYVWIRARRPSRALTGNGRSFKLVVASGIAALLILGTLQLTESGHSSQRRAESNAGRSAAFEVGLIAIAQSPILGYGSWTEDRELASLYLKRYLEYRGIRDPNVDAGKHFSPHSQVLQAWVEGGILGAIFFIILGYQLFRVGRWIFLERPVDFLTTLLVYFHFACAWNLLMSPFSAPHRIQIALGMALIVLASAERRHSRKAQRPESTVRGGGSARPVPGQMGRRGVGVAS